MDPKHDGPYRNKLSSKRNPTTRERLKSSKHPEWDWRRQKLAQHDTDPGGGGGGGGLGGGLQGLGLSGLSGLGGCLNGFPAEPGTNCI